MVGAPTRSTGGVEPSFSIWDLSLGGDPNRGPTRAETAKEKAYRICARKYPYGSPSYWNCMLSVYHR